LYRRSVREAGRFAQRRGGRVRTPEVREANSLRSYLQAVLLKNAPKPFPLPSPLCSSWRNRPSSSRDETPRKLKALCEVHQSSVKDDVLPSGPLSFAELEERGMREWKAGSRDHSLDHEMRSPRSSSSLQSSRPGWKQLLFGLVVAPKSPLFCEHDSTVSGPKASTAFTPERFDEAAGKWRGARLDFPAESTRPPCLDCITTGFCASCRASRGERRLPTQEIGHPQESPSSSALAAKRQISERVLISHRRFEEE